VSVANEILGSYQHVIDQLTLITGDKGIFDVVVNGDLIYSKGATGRHAEPNELAGLVAKIVGPEVRIYGT